LPNYFQAADIVAVPSHYESFGMVALEALATGAAVIASNVGGFALTIEDGQSVLLFPKDDAVALANQVARLLDHPEQAAALRTAARARAIEYGWGNIARRINLVYEELVNSRQAARRANRLAAQVS